MEQNYAILHVGINSNEEEGLKIAQLFEFAFGWKVKEGNSSVFAQPYVEVMKKPKYGTHGHIGILCNDIESAMKDLEAKGFHFHEASKQYTPEGKLKFVYMVEEFGGFALHLNQR